MIPQRKFGNSGESISCLGLGGSHLGQEELSDKDAIKIIRQAVDGGITFLDTSWDYNEGTSEKRIGKALKDGYREKAFLMTKIDGRTAKSATKQLEESLKRLDTDCVDLLQHHEVIRFEDADRIVAQQGAGEALEKARKEGKCRYIGFTGHKDPSVHRYLLDLGAKVGLKFDAVQLPLNPLDYHFRSFERDVLPQLLQQGIAPLGMKALSHGLLLKTGIITAEECLRYVLSLPVATLITGVESEPILQQAFKVGQNFQPFSEQEISELRGRMAKFAKMGKYELFKTSSHFDATAKHVDWLGEELPQVAALAEVRT
jgi:aryl-alcohol dehydrogenase-like predicted oxidoreductase